MRLENKVALISGGARGQGAVEAKLFAREGAKVVIGDVLDEEGKQVEAEITESGGEATYLHLDVTRAADWIAEVDTAVKRYGKLDVLVNNAGITIRHSIEARIPHLAQTSDAVNRQLSCFSSRYMNLLAVFQI